MKKSLTVTLQSDRSLMAATLVNLVKDCGASCAVNSKDTPHGLRETVVSIRTPAGLGVNVSLDGDSCQPDVHVLSWHMALNSDARLNEATFGGNVNPHHQRKATFVAYGFDELCTELQRGLTLAQDGTAFLPEIVKLERSPA
jgi:hypothetical protein